MILTIKNHELRVEIDTLGGEMRSISKQGTEYLWQGDPAYWTGQSPLLFPIVGHLLNKKIKIRGREITMENHGFIMTTELEVVRHEEDELVLITRYNEETLEHYPFKFEFEVSYKVVDAKLETRYKITNLDDEEMVYNFGLHPGFNCDLSHGQAIEDYYVEFPEVKTLESQVFNDDIRVEMNQTRPVIENQKRYGFVDEMFHRTIILHDIDFDHVWLGHKDRGHILKFSYEGFHIFAMYRAVGSPFICLEPWTGHDAIVQDFENMEENPTAQFLGVGESKEFSMTVDMNIGE